VAAALERALERCTEGVYSRVAVENEKETGELAGRGAEVREGGSPFIVTARRPDHLTEEYRERGREEVCKTLKDPAAMLTPIHSKRLEGLARA
jgi:hypothetical protein